MYQYLLFAFLIFFSMTTHVTAQDKAFIPEEERKLTLNAAVETAIFNNLQIKAIQTEQLKAKASTRTAMADLLPSFEANYNYTGFRDQPISKSSGMEIPVSHDNLFHWDVTVIQPLFTGFATSSVYFMAKTNEKIKKIEKEQTILTITQKVKSAYFQVLLSQKLLSVTEEAVQALQAHSNNAASFFAQDLIPENDLLKSQVALAQTMQEREKASANVVLARSNLNFLLGTGMDIVRELDVVDRIPEFDESLHDLINEALENRPVLKVLKLGLKTSEHAITLARSGYYPQVSLVGMYEQEGKDPGASENNYSNQENALIMAQAKWTFFEWGKTRAQVSEARQERQAIAIRLRELEDYIMLEVKKSFLNLEVSRKNIYTAQKALEQARENWRITKLQYDQQVANSTDVLDARSFLTQADANYHHALYGYLISLSELEKSVGRRRACCYSYPSGH